MKNSERQQKLDEEKYLKGFEINKDPSGDMPYCYYCDNQICIDNTCKVSHQERVKNNFCAKAYNKSKKRKEPCPF